MAADEAGIPASEAPSIQPGQMTRLLQDLTRAPDDCLTPASRVGDRIGRFLLVRQIGRGGFGVVFEAEDTHLRRRVAIKVLRPERGSSPSTLEWIQREGEAAARVHHPTVVTLHDVGQWEGGTYLVYELLEGETLTERLERGPLSRDEARRVLGSVAVGLSQMHAAGIVHRDLKPDNVFIETDGSVKILDLGLAQVAGAVGIVAGSPPYAAPEQWRGEATDARADVYAWGILARKLLEGKASGPTSASGPASARSFRALGERSRSQDPAQRPADGGALVAELDGIDRRRRRAALLAAAAAALAVVAAFYGLGRSLKPSPGPPSGPFRIAVADAENGTGRPALDGIGDLVARGLQGSTRLQVLDRARLVGVLRASGRAAPDRIDRGLARFATRQAGGAALLVPSVAEAGEVLSIEIEALEPESGKVLFAVREQAVSEQGVLPAVERLVGRVRVSLRDREPEVRAADMEISRAVSSSLQAHQHYLAGVRCVDRPTEAGFSSTAACEGHFRQALAIDPEFPLAHFELARLMYWNEHTAEELRTVLGPAIRNLERLPPREQALVRAWEASLSPDSRKEIDILLAAAREFPDDARIAFRLGDSLARQGRRPEAVPHLQRVFDLDPGFETAVGSLVWSLGVLDRTDDLLRIADRLALVPPSPGTLATEATARAAAGDVTGALQVARRAAPGGAGPAREALEHVLVAAGRWAEAETMLREDALRDPGGAPDRLGRFLFLRGRTREALAVGDPRSTAANPRLRFLANARQVHQVLDPRRDLEGVRRIADETATWSDPHAARFAFDLAYLGDTARALSLAPLLEDEPGSSALLEALVAWRKDGAAVALPALRRLARGDPVSAESGPPEAASWFAAECAVEAVGDESAIGDLHRFQRFYHPLGQLRTWAYPRSLLLEARLLQRLGRPAEARETLARLEDLLSQADADHPLLRDMRALRRTPGAGGKP